MKLGKDTGNVQNWLMSGSRITPIEEVKEGIDVTFLCWSDRTTGIVRNVDSLQGYVVVEQYEDCYDRCEPKSTKTDGTYIILKWSRGKWYEVHSKGTYLDFQTRKSVSYGEKLRHIHVLFGVRDGYYDETI